MVAKTIIYVGAFQLPDGNAAAHRVMANAKLFRDLGYSVILLGVRSGDGHGLRRYAQDFEGFECWSVSSPRSMGQWIKYLIGNSEVFQFLAGRSSSLAGVVCYNWPAISQLRIFRRSKRFGGVAISDTTEWYEVGAGALHYKIAKWVDVWLRMHWANAKADGVVAISPLIYQFYKGKGIPVVKLPSLFDRQQLQLSSTTADIRPLRFIYLGSPFEVARVDRRKRSVKDRVDLCIETFGQLHRDGFEFQFDIYGIGESQYLSVFPEHHECLRQLGTKVRFYGRVPNDELRRKLVRSHFSIFFREPTRVTLAGFPTKLAESVSHGVPVVTSDHDNLKDFAAVPGILLVPVGGEYEFLRNLLELPGGAVDSMIQECAKSSAFDYRMYVEPVKSFLSQIRRNRSQQ